MDMNSKTNEELLAEIDNRNTAIEAEAQKGDATDHNQIIQWRNEISMIQMTLSDRKAVEANQQRVEEAKTDAVTRSSLDGLDPDVSELIGIYVSDAIKKEQTKQDEQIQQLTEAHKGKLDNLTTQALETENQLVAERNVTSQLQEQVNSLQAVNSQILFDKQDADQKRDAAVREKEAETSRVNHLSNMVDDANKEIARLNQHVDELRVQLANAPAPKAAIDITPNERAQELIAKIQLKNVQYADFKRSILEGEDKDGNIVQVNYLDAAKIEHVTEFPSLPPIENPAEPVPTFPEDHQVSSEASETDPSGDRNEAVHEGVEQKAAEETLTLESLKAEIDALKTAHETTIVRVDNIERHANIQAVA